MRKTQHGFTMVEILVALTVVAILAGVAIPSLRQFSASSRTVATTNSLVTALAAARSEALRRSMPVTLCASADSQSCGTDWSKGWIVFTDASGTAGVLDGSDVLLQAWGAPGGNVSVTSSANTLQYNARGMANLAASVTFNTWVAGCRGPNQTQIVVTVGGSPQNTHIACP